MGSSGKEIPALCNDGLVRNKGLGLGYEIPASANKGPTFGKILLNAGPYFCVIRYIKGDVIAPSGRLFKRIISAIVS